MGQSPILELYMGFGGVASFSENRKAAIINISRTIYDVRQLDESQNIVLWNINMYASQLAYWGLFGTDISQEAWAEKYLKYRGN